MTQHSTLHSVEGAHFDVVICGGGLAGLTLARQLRQEHPDKRVLLLEKTERPLPEACHKVGESSVELGSAYFERLGLREYLRERQLFKFGLRFFPGGGHLPLEQRLEIGPMQEPIVPSYQLDRGTFEQDLRGFVEEDGVQLIEGATVRDIALGSGGEAHRVTFEVGGEDATRKKLEVTCRWVVDASGRNALLRRKLKITRGNRHAANSGWYRVKGKVDINTFVPKSVLEWHESSVAQDRWRSTNHFMGPGYWVWIIPLSSGNTSIGVVVHDEYHGFDEVRTLERCQAFIEKHEPVVALHLKDFEVLDFRCLRDYSHDVGRCWSTDRWALVGEAGAFVDPLYSPGSDFIAYANTFTSELMRVDDMGGDLATRCRDLNLQYRSLVSGSTAVYRDLGAVYGHPRAMLTKVFWDNFAYWSYPCQYFLRGIYKLEGKDAAPFITLGQRFVELSSYVQSLMREWALLSPEEPEAGFAGMPRFPSVVVDAHIALQDEMTPEQTFTYMQKRAIEGEEIVGELLLRVLGEIGSDKAQALAERAKIATWQITIDPSRIVAEPEVGLARRRMLSPIARDVERSLGKPRDRASEQALRSLVAPLLRERSASTLPQPAEA